MKSLNTYINEKFQVGNDNIGKYAYTPKDKDELIKCIKDKIEKEGLGTEENPLDLNDIDTSQITDMGGLFDSYYGDLIKLSENGNFDISDWNVSNVKDMRTMFRGSKFNGDLSNWDVSNVENMYSMFVESEFSGDISRWDISNAQNIDYMFYKSKFNGDIKNWNVSSVRSMQYIFYNCPLQNNPPKWYKG